MSHIVNSCPLLLSIYHAPRSVGHATVISLTERLKVHCEAVSGGVDNMRHRLALTACVS